MLGATAVVIALAVLLARCTSQRDCPGGYYRVNSTFAGRVPCPPGRYSSASHAGNAQQCFNVCPPGSYCPAGSVEPIPCPGGRYSDAYGLASINCSGPCKAGYFCPRGSTRATQYVCGNATYFCPEGSADRRPADAGFYTGPLSALGIVRYEQFPCPTGSFCMQGQLAPCLAGSFGNVTALSTSTCSGLCPPGSYCPSGSMLPTLCPAGVFGATSGLSEASCSGPCSAGFWCPEGSTSPQQRPCPGGRFGPTPGLGSHDCSSVCEVVSEPNMQSFCVPNICKAGYYCPPGSTQAAEVPCGDPNHYCPTGVALPIPVDPGFYSTGPLSIATLLQSADDETVRTGQQMCEPGYYCVMGVKTPCSAGSFGASLGLTNSSCSGACSPGFFCPQASISPNQLFCGDPGLYCLGGTAFPLPVPLGFYSYNSDGSPLTRVSIAPCPPGNYCMDGVKRPCPDGYFSFNGSSTPLCDGPCSVDQYCPSGTSSPITNNP